MGAYLVVVNDVSHAAGRTSGSDIIDWLLSRGIWVFPAASSAARKVAPGDALVIYLAGSGEGRRSFVGQADVISGAAPLPDSLRTSVHDLGLTWFDQFVRIKRGQRWKRALPIEGLIPKLAFITEKKNYGLALRLGLRRMSDKDYVTITRQSKG